MNGSDELGVTQSSAGLENRREDIVVGARAGGPHFEEERYCSMKESMGGGSADDGDEGESGGEGEGREDLVSIMGEAEVGVDREDA